MTVHQCHAVGCDVAVPPRMFMCGRHWGMIPVVYQKVIWRYYRPGQEIDKQPSLDYLAVAFAGIACVALQEGRTPPQFIQRAHEPQAQVSEGPRQAPIEREIEKQEASDLL